MTRDEWQEVKAIASAALDRADDARLAFVTAACGGNPALEREVRSLLSFTDRASGRFETVAFEWAGVAGGPLRGALERVRRITAAGSGSRTRIEAGTIINGRYRVEAVAGEGGMGAVYRVTDLAQARTLALKTVRGDPRFVTFFKVEFRTLVELRHPHLARSYDFEPIVGSPDYCFTMDFVEGRTIFDETRSAPWPVIVELFVQLCRTLAYVHNRGLVHRDIKPNNVLVAAGGTVKLVDFGLVGGQTSDGLLIGTPAYLAPELIDRGAGDHRSDLYSLGILLYELLCRRLPPDGAIVFSDDAVAPPWLREIVARLCAREPADRFRGANQVIEAINHGAGADHPVETEATRESYVVSGRFVGRQDERAALLAFARARLVDSLPAAAIALVSGQSGVGKSRLVRELRYELQLDRQVFVEGDCFEGAAVEYGAFAAIVAELVPLLESRGAGAFVNEHLSELVKVAPAIGRSRIVPPSPSLATPEAEQRRLLDGVAAFLVGTGAFMPYALYVNDLQWAPEGTVEILRYLCRRIHLEERSRRPVRLALVASYRHDEVAARPVSRLLADVAGLSIAVRLQPLEAEPMQRLLTSMFGLDSIPAPFVARVLEEAAGSPFFLEEVVRALVENGSVFVADGAWRTTHSIGELEIPRSVVAALRRRVALIGSRNELAVLKTMAAFKKPIPVTLLAAVTGLEAPAVDEAIHELAARQMVTPADVNETAYRTAHDHLRTTVYDDLADEAAPLHRAIARGLEQLYENGPVPLSELAHHTWLARDHADALRYALLAGDAARLVYANGEAIEHLEHALQLMPDGDHATRAQVTEKLADAHFLAGNYERTKALLADASALVADLLDKTRVQRKLGDVVGYSAGTPHEAVDILWNAARALGARQPRSRAMFLARSVATLGRHFAQQVITPRIETDAQVRARLTELASIYVRIAYFNFFADPMLLFLPVLRAANAMDRVGESKEHSNIYSLTAIALGGLGFSRRAHEYGVRAIAEAERSASPWHVANARSFHALVLLQTGDWDGARDHAEGARTGFAACGDHFELAVALYTILELQLARGDLIAARDRGRDELAVFERLGLQMIGKGPFTQFGRVLAKTGDNEGIAVGQDVLARAQHGADKLSTVLANLGLGDSFLHLGRVDEAIEHLEQAMAIRDRNGFHVYVAAHGSALLAQAYMEKFRGGVAYDGPARRAFDQRVSQAAAAASRFPPMQSPANLVRGLQCRLRGRRAQAAACFGAAIAQASALGARLWQAEAHFEQGRASLDDDGRGSGRATRELDAARMLFQASGAKPRETAVERMLTR